MGTNIALADPGLTLPPFCCGSHDTAYRTPPTSTVPSGLSIMTEGTVASPGTL